MGKAIITWAASMELVNTHVQFGMFTQKIPTEFLLFKAAVGELE